MLTTFVIGLREGLEAALIVGIIAAFLRRNGVSLRAMWLGVGLAVLLSLAVGVGLAFFEHALPQAAQEGMESAIGALAVIFVTGMTFWMNRHARGLRKEIEAEAAEALGHASAIALAGMAFLAVLKEGFETSVFLLATFSAAQSPLLAAGGAVMGLLLAIAIGWGIYMGGIRLNLSRFFRITGAFLILVAAGLVVSSLRTAHEAGWLLAGQQPTLSLIWLVAPGTVQSALVTGVLGIPADPRRIELIGWLAYLLPVAVLVYWPAAWRPAQGAARLLRVGVAGVLVLVAAGLAIAYPRPGPDLPATAPIMSANGETAGAIALTEAAAGGAPTLTLSLNGAAPVQFTLLPGDRRGELRDGFDAGVWSLPLSGPPANAPATLALDQVVALAGGRMPVGLNARQHPGPFDAVWSSAGTLEVASANGVLLDASAHGVSIVTLTGGGLATARTISVAGGTAENWQLAPDYHAEAIATLGEAETAALDWQFWAVDLPIGLLALALLLAVSAALPARPKNPTTASGAPRATKIAAKGAPRAAQ